MWLPARPVISSMPPLTMTIRCLSYHWDDVDGELDYLATYTDGTGGVDGLIGVQAITISPDGKHLYAASELDNSLAVYSRDLATGALTWVATYTDGLGGNEYLAGAYEMAVSPDGKHVYLAAYIDDAITVFSRNATTGALTRFYVYQDGGSALRLDGVNSLVVSPDNNEVYAVSRLDDTLTVFHRNTSTGALTWAEHYIDATAGVDGLDGARALAIDPAGGAVYVASQFDHALAYFLRDPATGLLKFVHAYKDNTPGIDGLNVADALSVSPDGKTIYVSGYGDDAVAAFRWDYLLDLPFIARN